MKPKTAYSKGRETRCQREGLRNAVPEIDIATDGGRFKCLTDAEIDALCLLINLPD